MNESVFQIFITDAGEPISNLLERSTNTVKKFSIVNNNSYQLFGNEEIRNLINKNFDPIVSEVYEALIPYAYKSDLARYCILYTRGGWYFDVGIEINSQVIVNSEIETIFFRDIQKNSQSSWSIANGVLYTKPQNKLFLIAIEMIINNYKKNYYGLTPLCPTGPTLFGRAVAMHGLTENNIFGDLINLTPLHKIKNTAFVLPNGAIFAWGKKAEGGDLRELGALGVNNYNDLWRDRKIYIQK